MSSYQLLFTQAIEDKSLTVSCDNHKDANNIRQRMYRARDKIRADKLDPLNLIVDGLSFEIIGALVFIEYTDPNQILENSHVREEPGDRTLNLNQRSTDTTAQG